MSKTAARNVTDMVSGADRLVDAARVLFAARGYEGTSVRDIVQQAGTNLNSINYYFGGKQGLYTEVLKREHARAAADAERRLAPPDTRADAAKRLHQLIERMLFLFLDRESLLPRLAALEIVNPSPAFEAIGPALHAREQAELADIVAKLLGQPSGESALVRQCVRSVLSQCAYYMFTASVLQRMPDAPRADTAAIRKLAQHVSEFSLHAIAGLRRSAR